MSYRLSLYLFKQPNTMIGFFENQYKKVSEITLPITATTINRSYAGFEYFTLVNGKPFYLDRHLNRLFNTLKLLRIEFHYTLNDLYKIINTLLEKNSNSDVSFKIFVIPEPLTGYQTFKSELYIVPIQNQLLPKKDTGKGSKLLVKNYQRFLPEAKTTNYTAYMYWEHEVLMSKAIDVLYTSQNYVRETSRSNVFMVKNKAVYTPKNQLLNGITKSIVIDLIKNNTIDFIEHDFTLDDLLKSDEVFITSTTKEITAITQLDSSYINLGIIGPVTKKLQNEFKNLKEMY